MNRVYKAAEPLEFETMPTSDRGANMAKSNKAQVAL